MILLLDLDDTLITNRIDTFLSIYLKSLGRYFADSINPDRLIKELLSATRAMVENNRADRTLEEAFDEQFYPALGRTKAEMRPALDDFYATVYPQLKGIISPRPEARQLVEAAMKRGYRLVIATNPLFPSTAILQRLAWGGLPVESYPFEIVTSYEAFHFAKPNPAYYTEIIAQLGCPNEPAIMVGNDLESDIKPAELAGMATFWLTDKASQAEPIRPTALQGSMGDLLDWIERGDPTPLVNEFSTIEALKINLLATPAGLASLARRFAPEQWIRRPAPGEWCLTEIICHLRDVDREVNLPRLEKFKAEENPFFAGVITDPWATERNYIQQDGMAALRDFTIARQHNLDILNQLPGPDWNRSSRHAIFGPTPLKELVSFIARHDRNHLQQAYRLLKP